MAKILIDDIIPILVIMAVGYVLGRTGFFNDEQRQGFNKLVLNIALPAALFISITDATRAMFAKDITLTLISIFGVTGLFMVCYWLDKLMFHRTTAEAAVCAMIAGSPTIGFLGFAVLDPIYGDNATTNLVIGIVSIVVNAITIPIGLSLVERGVAQEAAKKRAAAAANGEDVSNMKEVKAIPAWKSILNALKKPVAWSPLLAVIVVLCGIRIPKCVAPTFNLIAKANSGVAVLAAGIALSTVSFSFSWEVWWNTFYRLILTPAIIVAIAYLCGMGKTPEGLTQISMLCLSTALPPALSGVIISSRYNIYVKEGTSSVAVSTVGFALTLILWTWVLPLIPTWF